MRQYTPCTSCYRDHDKLHLLRTVLVVLHHKVVTSSLDEHSEEAVDVRFFSLSDLLEIVGCRFALLAGRLRRFAQGLNALARLA